MKKSTMKEYIEILHRVLLFILDHLQINTLISITCMVDSENMLFKDGGFNTFIENMFESSGYPS